MSPTAGTATPEALSGARPRRRRSPDPARTHLQVPLRETCGRSRAERVVRFTVTPLGGARSDVGRVVDGIVRYLQPKAVGVLRPGPAKGRDRGSVAYYADSGEEPGRWLGRAAEQADLDGEVQREDFAAVLSGRDPHTGERLISAQGSAGRRGHLGTGNATRTAPDGTLLYDEADAATVLGVTKAEVTRMFDVGTAVAIGQLGGGRIRQAMVVTKVVG